MQTQEFETAPGNEHSNFTNSISSVISPTALYLLLSPKTHD